jgi:hypothetical protein
MKTFNSKLRRVATRILICACLLQLAACKKKIQPDFSPDIALMPEANVVLSMDLDAMRKAPIYHKLAAIAKENQAALQKVKPKTEDYRKLAQDLETITGLTNQDVSQILMACKLTDLEFSGEQAPPSGDLEFALAMPLKKSLPLEKLRQALVRISVGAAQPATVSTGDYSDTPMVIASQNSLESPRQVSELASTVLNRDKLVLTGTPKSVKAALERSASGRHVSLSPELELLRNLAVDSQFRLLFALPPALQEKLRKKAAAGAKTPQANLTQALQSLKSVSCLVTFDQKLHLTLAGVLGSEQDANQVRTQLDNMVIGMAKMGLSLMVKGKPLPMLDTLKTETRPNAIVLLSLSIGGQDIDTLREVGIKAPHK